MGTLFFDGMTYDGAVHIAALQSSLFLFSFRGPAVTAVFKVFSCRQIVDN